MVVDTVIFTVVVVSIIFTIEFFVPNKTKMILIKKYLEFWRRITPDFLYKLWYRTGIMDEQSYRSFQEKGYISDDVDPEYLNE